MRQPLVERHERRLHRVDGEPLQVVERVAEGVDQGRHLVGHRGPLISRLSVLTVTRKCSRRSSPIGCSAIEAAAPVCTLECGHISSGMRLSRTYAASRPSSTVAVVADVDVVDDADAVAEPVGAAPLDGLPDRRQPEGLARVDGEVGVLALEVLEGVEVAGGRVARLGARDVEADDAPVAVAAGELGDLQRARLVPHRGEQLADHDRVAAGCAGHPLVEARAGRPRRPRRASGRRRGAARGRSAPRRRRRRRRPGPRRTRGHPGQRVGASA